MLVLCWWLEGAVAGWQLIGCQEPISFSHSLWDDVIGWTAEYPYPIGWYYISSQSSVLNLSSTLINCYLLNICIHVNAKGPNLLHWTFSSMQILKIKLITYKGCVNDFRELPTRPGVPTINLPIVAKPGNWFWKTFLNKCLFVCLSILFTTKEVPRIL